MHDASGTWHYGLVARWWAEFTAPKAHEVDYYAAAIRRYGEPALDLGCGNGRILMPLLEQGLDVDHLEGGHGGYAGEPVSPDDPVVMFVARKAS
jgi:hypothetical protein